MNTHIAGNLFLVGLMGAGKTTLGRQLAMHFQRPFYDSDQIICERTGVTIPTIFEMEGEQGFRKRESAVIQELSTMRNIVLATGGGAVLYTANRSSLKCNGTVVYLHAQPETLFARVSGDRSRPLLQVADPLARFRELYQARDALYRETAHIVLDVGAVSSQVTFNQLLTLIHTQ